MQETSHNFGLEEAMSDIGRMNGVPEDFQSADLSANSEPVTENQVMSSLADVHDQIIALSPEEQEQVLHFGDVAAKSLFEAAGPSRENESVKETVKQTLADLMKAFAKTLKKMSAASLQ